MSTRISIQFEDKRPTNYNQYNTIALSFSDSNGHLAIENENELENEITRNDSFHIRESWD